MADVQELDRVPNLGLLFAKAVATSFTGGEELPATELVLPEIRIDRDHLAAYNRVCGYALSDTLPPTYLHHYVFPLAMQLMATPSFPFALPGVVHIANRITHRRPVSAAERIRLRVRLDNLRPHDKGRQFDFVAEATVDGEPVWTEVSTNLRRGGGSNAGNGGGGPAPEAPPATAVWRVQGDTGRRYAAVSGDRNPIHLYPLTARAFGFPRPIAHGMWTKARCLASLQGRLPERFTVAVDFKLPLLLPGTVAFSTDVRGQEWTFAVRGARNGKPHLDGILSPL
jgi:acyl dehydratase